MAAIEDAAGITDEISVTVKGPDPDVWGDPADRLAQDVADGKTDGSSEAIIEKLKAGEEPVVELPDGTVVKGPDPAVWGNPFLADE